MPNELFEEIGGKGALEEKPLPDHLTHFIPVLLGVEKCPILETVREDKD